MPISLKAFWQLFQTHKHTAAEVGAAAADHSHTPESIGAARANHTHSPSSLGIPTVRSVSVMCKNQYLMTQPAFDTIYQLCRARYQIPEGAFPNGASAGETWMRVSFPHVSVDANGGGTTPGFEFIAVIDNREYVVDKIQITNDKYGNGLNYSYRPVITTMLPVASPGFRETQIGFKIRLLGGLKNPRIDTLGLILVECGW